MKALLWRKEFARFTRFATVGIANTIASTSVYLLATRGVGLAPLRANALAFSVAVCLSYLLNRRWTFDDSAPPRMGQFAMFVLVGIVGLGASEATLWLLHSIAGIHDLIAFFISIGATMVVTFVGNRTLTFRRS